MNLIPWQKRVMALAGAVQAVHLVAGIARTGMASQDAMESSLRSVFVTDPESISEIYEGTNGIRLGIRRVAEMLTGFDMREHGEDLRYTLAVLKLEQGLRSRPDLVRELGAGIARIDQRRRLEEEGGTMLTGNVVEDLATLYDECLGSIEPRIRVTGNRHHLQRPENIHRIRALLLAAVRSAVLFHQVGGRRWQFLFSRRKLAAALAQFQYRGE